MFFSADIYARLISLDDFLQDADCRQLRYAPCLSRAASALIILRMPDFAFAPPYFSDIFMRAKRYKADQHFFFFAILLLMLRARRAAADATLIRHALCRERIWCAAFDTCVDVALIAFALACCHIEPMLMRDAAADGALMLAHALPRATPRMRHYRLLYIRCAALVCLILLMSADAFSLYIILLLSHVISMPLIFITLDTTRFWCCAADAFFFHTLLLIFSHLFDYFLDWCCLIFCWLHERAIIFFAMPDYFLLRFSCLFAYYYYH